ncbi:MAG: VWA domain-containing protein [Planctomycetes bacterium]|nr:VWA domain-containing protein [Planctomycetota bacterium]
MDATVGSPWALLAAPLLLAFVLLAARRSLAGLEPWRGRLALGARALLLLLVLLGLAEVEVDGAADRVSVVVAVDRSRSIPAARAQEAERLVAALAGRVRPPASLHLVTFGAAAQHEGALGPGGPSSPIGDLLDRDATDIEAGLLRALEAVEAGARGRVLLLTDGNATAGDAARALARARHDGVAVDVVPLTYAHEAEVLVEKVSVPAQAAVDEPYRARVVIAATAPCPALLRVWRDGALVETRRLDLRPGSTVEEVQLTNARPGFARIEAAVEPLDPAADALPQNNVAHGFVHTPGRSRILHVSLDPEAPSPLVDALREAGFVVEAVHPAALPLDQGGYQDLDAVVLDGPPRRAFSERQLAAVEAAVAHQGVGLIMVGGPDGFGAGDWGHSPVEEALPVRMEPKTTDAVLSTALVLVIDRSGSMSGEKLEMAKAAAVAAARALAGGDRVGVVAFDTVGTWTSPLAPASDVLGLRTRVESLDSGGGTSVAAGLRPAFAALRGVADAAVKHVILLSDGQSEQGDQLDQAVRARGQGITLSCVGIGQDADNDHLRLLARAGAGRHYEVPAPRDLPRIFAKETRRVARPLLREVAFTPEPQPAARVLGVLEAPPPLRGLVLTEPKPRAEVALTGPDGAPVLATWQYGLGRSIAFTSDARPVWAPDWVAWDGFTAFWAQALRWVARDVESGTLAVAARLDGSTGRVVVDALDAAGDLVDGLAVEAHVRPPGAGEGAVVVLSPRGGGRYDGAFPADGHGTYELTIKAVAPSGRREALTTGLVVPWSDEFRPLRADAEALRALAHGGGGRVVPLWDLLEGRADPWEPSALPARASRRETWPLALAAAAVVLLLDVAVRRVSLPARRAAPPPTTAAAPAARLASLRAGREARRAAPAPDPTPASPVTPSPAGPQVAPRPQPGTAASPPQAPPEGDPAGSLTERLLEAKRRAGRARDGDAQP